MTTYITLFKWTAQGVKTARDSVNRYEKARQEIEKRGGRIVCNYWTQGRFDLVNITEWPDEDSYTAFLLVLAGQGNLQSETLRGFSAEDMTRIFLKMG